MHPESMKSRRRTRRFRHQACDFMRFFRLDTDAQAPRVWADTRTGKGKCWRLESMLPPMHNRRHPDGKKKEERTMSEEKVYDVPADVAKLAHIDSKKYKEMYERSVKDPDSFWAEQAQEFVTWSKPWTRVSDWSYDAKNLHLKWFEGGKLNVSYNCLARHLEKRGIQIAILWEGDDPKDDRKITYRE